MLVAIFLFPGFFHGVHVGLVLRIQALNLRRNVGSSISWFLKASKLGRIDLTLSYFGPG